KPAAECLALPTLGRNLAAMICLGGLRRLNPRAVLIAALCFAVPTAQAQQPAAPNAQSGGKLDALKQHDEELKTLRDQQQKSVETEAGIKRQIEEIGADRRKLNQALIDTAARVRDVEAKAAATEEKLKPLDARETALRKSLDDRRGVIGEVLAALQ